MPIKQKEFRKQWTNKKETSQNPVECDESLRRHCRPKRPPTPSLFAGA